MTTHGGLFEGGGGVVPQAGAWALLPALRPPHRRSPVITDLPTPEAITRWSFVVPDADLAELCATAEALGAKVTRMTFSANRPARSTMLAVRRARDEARDRLRARSDLDVLPAAVRRVAGLAT